MTSLMDTLDSFRPLWESPQESAGLRVAVFLDELGKKILEAWEILRGREVIEVFLEVSVSSVLVVFCVVR